MPFLLSLLLLLRCQWQMSPWQINRVLLSPWQIHRQKSFTNLAGSRSRRLEGVRQSRVHWRQLVCVIIRLPAEAEL